MADEVPNEVLTVYKKIGRATAAMAGVSKSKTADTGKYTYSYTSLTEVLQVVKEALKAQDLVLMQPITPNGEGFTIATTVIDLDTGITVNFPGPMFLLKGDPQAVGSAISYGRRYALTSLFALEADDDDGAQAARAVNQPDQRTEAEKKIRKWLAAMPDAMSKEDFQAEFLTEFGCGLSGLPESRHGDALTWVVEYAEAHALNKP